MTVNFARTAKKASTIEISSAVLKKTSYTVSAGAASITVPLSLSASNNNTVTISTHAQVLSIDIAEPEGTFYASTLFSVSGTAAHQQCTAGLCQPVGSKVTNLTAFGTATLNISNNDTAISSSRYVEVTYINNDVAIATSWTDGRNARNITVSVNGGAATRLEVPLSGRSSELYSPMRGWGDPATLGVLTTGWGLGVNGTDTIEVSNVGGDAGVEPYGADFVGIRVF